MKQLVISLFLGGMVALVGLVAAPSAQAEEALPNGDQLTTEITTEANSTVTQELGGDSTSESTTTTDSSQPTATSTPQASDTLIINTGDDVEVDSSSSTESDTEIDNRNDANVDQEVNVGANTGNNTANRNISFGGDAGTIVTGDATVLSEVITEANTNQTGVSGTCAAPSGSDGSITNTGDDLEYDAGSSADCQTTVSNGNGATINQVVNAEANTGGNEAERNIAIGGGSAGSITTGNATVGTMVVTRANQSMVLVGGESNNGAPGSGANIYIINTGDDLDVEAGSRSETDIEVDNHNQADITQGVNVSANTGGNDSSRNINTNGDAGVIQTGDATVVTELEANANTNHTVIGTGDSSGNSGSNTEIVNTGDDVEVDAETETETDIEVNNNNEANVDQEVNVAANTGNNTADRNIAFNGDAGSITTGDATVITSVETDVNHNTTAVLTGGSSNEISSGNTADIVNTGDDLEVDVSSEIETDIEVNNDNEANVDQEVNVAANTGNNTASGNVGNTSMTTGDITVTTEIITNANNNYTFIVDSNVNGLELFKQFVEAFLGMNWEDLINGGGTDNQGNNVSLVNTGDNAQVLAQNTTTKKVQVNNNNQANVNQQVNVHANTGNNTCKDNVGGCDIRTGDAIIWTKLVANLNNNFTFVGNVQLPTPEVPEEPETPIAPEQPEEVERPRPQVLGESVERPQAVLAAATLPMTGGINLALLGLALIGGGLSLRLRKANA